MRHPTTTPAACTRSARPQRGAALLLAMVAVTLVATLAAGMVWQQWRAIQVEAAERARAQSGWVLIGALDWSRLILREDGRTGRVDHLGEPWATPLAEARLSTFLAADRDNNADSGPEAFLSGAIDDAQARYNLRNLMGEDGKVVPAELATLARLCSAASLQGDLAGRLSEALARAWRRTAATDAEPDPLKPLPVSRLEQLAWLGFDAATISALRPHVDILPVATPVNLNTASRDVIAATLDVDLGTAARLVQVRQRSPFESLERLKPLLPEGKTADPKRVGVASSFFHVSGRLRLEERVLEEQSLMQRRGTGSSTEVVTLRRERRQLLADTL
jgi:general secretion pathway protein K